MNRSLRSGTFSRGLALPRFASLPEVFLPPFLWKLFLFSGHNLHMSMLFFRDAFGHNGAESVPHGRQPYRVPTDTHLQPARLRGAGGVRLREAMQPHAPVWSSSMRCLPFFVPFLAAFPVPFLAAVTLLLLPAAYAPAQEPQRPLETHNTAKPHELDSVPGMPGSARVHAFTALGIGVWLEPDGFWRLSGIPGLYNVEIAGHKQPAEIPRRLLPTAEVYEVVDGDTVRVRFDGPLPPGIDAEETVRLLAADTPELDAHVAAGAYGRAAAQDAKEFLCDLVAGRTVSLAFEDNYRDQFGRLLAYVFLESGLLVNAELVRTGHAQVYRHIPTHFHDYFLELEARSRPTTGLPIVIGQIFNRGIAEFVELLNVGGRFVDLSGYVLEDRAGNRLVLPRGTGLAPNQSLRVYSGSPPDADTDLYLSEEPIWNNSGDTVFLKSPIGAIVQEYAY